MAHDWDKLDDLEWAKPGVVAMNCGSLITAVLSDVLERCAVMSDPVLWHLLESCIARLAFSLPVPNHVPPF